MSGRISVEDLEYLLKEDDEQGGDLRKQMTKTASKAADYWNGIVAVLGAEGKARKPRSKSEDGLTHGQAILEALKNGKPKTTDELLEALASSGHEMSKPVFYQTMNALTKSKEVKKAKIEKGKRANVYTVK